MEKTQEIIWHIEELYTVKPDKDKFIKSCEENPTRYQAWEDAFKEYDLSDVLTAIDEYWEFKNSKTKPNVAQIKAKLNAKQTEKLKESSDCNEVLQGDFAFERMNADIKAGSCHNNLYVYKDAEKIVLDDWLAREMPASIWAKMSYGSKLKQAIDKGLMNNFEEALRQSAQKRFGRDCEFEQNMKLGNVSEVINELDWRM